MSFRFRCTSSVLVVSLFLGACSHADTPSQVAPAFVDDHGVLRVPQASPLRSRLKVESVSSQTLPHAVSAPARVEADPARSVNVLAPLAGRVVALAVGLGDRVKRGQILAVIDSADYAQAVTDQRKAADALVLAKAAFARAKGVEQAGGAAVKDLEAARSGLVQARAEDDRARARLDAIAGAGAAHGNPRRMAVVSPEDGSVTTLSMGAGTFVNDTTATLMTITNLGHVWITADVAENESAEIVPGLPTDTVLPGLPGRHVQGTVQSVSDVLDADSRRVKARIAVPNPDGALKANMFATATFQVPQPPTLLVPQSALLMNNDNVTVFVEVSPWAFVRRTVVLGADEGDKARIVEGLRPGERIVVAGGVLIND